jgi:type VII secretion protein EccB
VQSRRDHLQAYRFSVARLVRAAATGDAVSEEQPARRAGLGVSVGAVLGALACGAALVYGVISPKPTTAWKDPGSIIVDTTNGTRYVYLNGVLRPTANYASALLLAGQQAQVRTVTGAQLAGVPVGSPMGIPGAPDSVPAAADLLTGGWALCQTGSGGAVLDLAPTGRTRPLSQGTEVLAEAVGTTAEYVIRGTTRYPVTDPAVLPALGLGTVNPVPVPPAWLAALPAGPALTPAAVPGAGGPGSPVAGRPSEIGQVFDTVGVGVEQYYVLTGSGLAPMTATEAALLASVPGAAPAVGLTPAQVAEAPASADRSLLTRLPDLVGGSTYGAGAATGPQGTDLCVLEQSPGTVVGGALVTENASALSGIRSVRVPPGAAMLVQPPSAPGAVDAAPVYMVADTGLRYLIDGSDAVSDLGYSEAPVQVLPAQVLALIPAGPDLDATEAATDAGTS